MKKVLSLILSAVMLLSLVPLTVFSVSAVTDSQGVEYSLSADGTYYTVSDCNSSVTEVIIPAEYNGKPVKEIGEYAFSYRYSLTSIEIPDSVTSIGDEAFSWCSSLTSITVSSGNTVYKSAGNCLIKIASKTLIAGCKNSVIPSDGSVTSIGSYAFEDCTSLTSIEIPDSVTSIGGWAFSYCRSLTSIEIPDSVTNIGGSAFYDCENLTDIYCEAESQPDGWATSWLNECSATVHWGYDISSEPEVSEPEVSEPDESEPEVSEPETSEPESSEPEVSEPETSVPEESKPEESEPETSTPETSEPEVSEPETSEPETSEPEVDGDLGDIDADGDVDAADYILVKRAVLKTYELTETQKTVADVDADGDIDATDYVLVKRIVLGTYKIN